MAKERLALLEEEADARQQHRAAPPAREDPGAWAELRGVLGGSQLAVAGGCIYFTSCSGGECGHAPEAFRVVQYCGRVPHSHTLSGSLSRLPLAVAAQGLFGRRRRLGGWMRYFQKSPVSCVAPGTGCRLAASGCRGGPTPAPSPMGGLPSRHSSEESVCTFAVRVPVVKRSPCVERWVGCQPAVQCRLIPPPGAAAQHQEVQLVELEVVLSRNPVSDQIG
jgi:hypothetical protein